MADPQRFAPVAAGLVQRARQAGNPEALVLALRAMAWAQRARLAAADAKRLLDQAARIARRHRLDQPLADVLTSRAAVNQELGRLAAAQRDLDSAARLVSPDQAAESAFQQAVLHQNIGRLKAAATSYLDLLSSEATPRRIRVIAGNNLAMIDAQHGRHGEALKRLDDAARLAEEVGPALVAMVLETRAWVTTHSGRLAEGLRLFEAAGRAHEAAGLPMGEHFVEYADALMDLRLIPEASMAARSAADVFRRSGVPLMGAEAELRIAQLAMLSGDLAEAEVASRVAAGEFARQGRGAWKARAELVKAEARLRAGAGTAADLREARRVSRLLESLGTWSTAVDAYAVAGRIAASLGRARDAAEAFQRAADLSQGNPVLVRLRGHVAAAMAARLRRRDVVVLRHCRSGLNDLARHRAALPTAELRALASGHGAELGQVGLDVVVRDGTPRRVFDWMERTRAAALLTVEPPATPDIEEDLDALRAVHAELAMLGQQADRGATVSPSLLNRQLTIENRIRRATWHGRAPHSHVPATLLLPALRDSLAGRVLVEYGLLGDRLIAVAVEPRRSRLVELGPIEAVLDQVRALLFALRRLTQPRPESSLEAARLSAVLRVRKLKDLLVQPLRLAPDAELVVVPVGQLHSVPWSSLADGPVSLAPSAYFWARSREAAGRTAGTGAAVLVEGPYLRGAATEVRRLGELYPQATVITPPDSTAQAVLRLLDGADLVHFACHGWLRSDNPMFSSLILSDGPLTVQELASRGVAPRRLVLASCQSGADVSYDGDEVLGFVSAVLARGTAGVVASVAAVPDVAAVDLMCGLHERLIKGRTLARALYEAREELDRDDPASYVNWCTFNAHGAA
ncbi:MAG TPA: CHAT domain-containing protein [Micromonosporaceae bacterium]